MVSLKNSLKGWGETVLATSLLLMGFGAFISVDILTIISTGLLGGLFVGSFLYGLGFVMFKLISASMPPEGSGKRQRFNVGERVLIYFAVMVVILILRYFAFGSL